MLWSAFYPEVLIAAIGCPNPVLEAKTREAASEFFRRTRAWVEWLDPVIALEGSIEYDFDVPTGAEVARVERATVDGKPIEVVSYRAAPHDWARADLTEQGVVSRDLTTFRLGNAVAAGLPVQVQVTLTPGRASTGLPDDLYDKYRYDIVHGIKAKVLGITGTDFYKPDVAMLESALFETAISGANVQSWRGLTANTPRARVKFC